MSSADDVLEKSVMRGMKGVGGVCGICMCLPQGGREASGLGMGCGNRASVGRVHVFGLHRCVVAWVVEHGLGGCYVCV